MKTINKKVATHPDQSPALLREHHRARRGRRREIEEQVVSSLEPLVRSLVGRTLARNPKIDRDDLLAVGRAACLRAVRSYDPSRGDRLGTYAHVCIQNALRQEVGSSLRQPRTVPILPVDEEGRDYCHEPTSQTPPVENTMEHREEIKLLRRALDRLPYELARVLSARFGLIPGSTPLSWGEIAKRMGLSVQRVQELHEEALAMAAVEIQKLSGGTTIK